MDKLLMLIHAIHAFLDNKTVYPVNESPVLLDFRENSNNHDSELVGAPLSTKYDNNLDCFGVGKKFSNVIMDWALKLNPNGTSALKIKFYSITRNNKRNLIRTDAKGRFSFKSIDFNISRPTVLIVHGFLANADEVWIDEMTSAFLEYYSNVNIFIVDWSDGGNTWNYYKAAVNTRTAGDQIATFFGQLVHSSRLSRDAQFGKLHFVGHSLGAHICGYAAKEMRNRPNKWLVDRITGLDPAQPCFKDSDKSLGLSRGDAAFIDVIHTNGRLLTRLGLGLPHPMGNIDFYPNGGKLQPGCKLSDQSIPKYIRFLNLPIGQIKQTICSHGRAYEYFTDSILAAVKNKVNCTFWAKPWDMSYDSIERILHSKCDYENCIEMGINSEKYKVNGTYLSITGNSRPFCEVNDGSILEVKSIMSTARFKRQIGILNLEGRKLLLIVNR